MGTGAAIVKRIYPIYLGEYAVMDGTLVSVNAISVIIGTHPPTSVISKEFRTRSAAAPAATVDGVAIDAYIRSRRRRTWLNEFLRTL